MILAPASRLRMMHPPGSAAGKSTPAIPGPFYSSAWRSALARADWRRRHLSALLTVGLHALVLFGVNLTPVRAARTPPGDSQAKVNATLFDPWIPAKESVNEIIWDDGKSPVEPAATPGPTTPSVNPMRVAPGIFQMSPSGFAVPVDVLLPATSLPSMQLPASWGRLPPVEHPVIYSINEVDRIPEAILQVEPVIPQHLRNKLVRETVTLGFVVTSQGKVSGVFVARSSLPGLDADAIAAVGRWKFRPGKKDGRNVHTRVILPIIFSTQASGGSLFSVN